ncbi:NAD(P)-dependent alcohol dehydrogenase [Rubrobacter taiwanensis]|uniref:NAD(P)-dependent alcohol dehydrogenase n=1 Tax=Rubrobacter taiwanensis TaxID=185139 RepID=A0A4R1BDB4_9ACTN|nr:NAD(P)-dependent alcohol dehydrogenase [Rubrobacter taiwanensis]TCJ15086.1 NAD(P)-dependent alcohol dehydrogenase [Rubrobacter taiwanensis]
MAETMKMLAFLGIEKVGVIEKPIPEPGPRDAIIRTTSSLVCTSDVHTVKGVIEIPEERGLGHESVGIVHRVGSDVERFKEGDRVAVNAITPCGRCDYCQRGFTSQCGGMLGGYKFTGQKDGNMAEYFHVNDADFNLVHIPDSLSDEQALYATDMLSTGFAGAENADIPIGGTVTVFAQGPVGLSATIGARLLGAGLIITVESKPDRAELSRKFGADEVVDPTQGDPVQKILDLTDGEGVDSAIESLGMPETFENCIRATKPGGTISNIGYHGEGGMTLSIPLPEFGYGMSDKKVQTALCPGGRERMNRILRLMEIGKVDPTPMTTHRFPFSEVERAFQMMATKEDNIIKPLITY